MGRPGMKIRAGDGCEEPGHPEMLSTPLFYQANPGDKLTLLDENYKFNVATYRQEVEPRWIYTYDYAPDQSWTIYNHDLNGDNYRQDEYTFNEKVYFRVCLRKVNGDTFDGLEDINKILMFDSKDVPAVNKPWIKNEVWRVTKRVDMLRKTGDRVFILLTDSHYTVNGTWDDTFAAVKQLSNEIKPDGIIHLGDMTDGMVTGDATRHYIDITLENLRSCGVPVWLTLGNHDSNYFRSNPESFTAQQQKEIYFSGKNIRYYIDLPEIRMIFIDSYDPKEKQRYGYNPECITWLDNTLKEAPAKSRILIFSHLPPLTRLQYWTDKVRGDVEIMDILKQYPNKNLHWINGHNHADGLDNNEGFPIISITNAKCEFFKEHKPEGAVVPERKLNDVTQEAFDVMIVRKKDDTIHFIRFGAGRNKIISNGKVMWI